MTTNGRSVAVVKRTLASLAPSSVRTGAAAIDSIHEARLLAPERALAAHFGRTRTREFATGRALLRALVGADVPITIAANRSPSMPDGVVGTLAHDDEIAVAAVSTSPAVRALGIDIEPIVELDPDSAAVILRPGETIDAILALTIKEAIFKAWSSVGGRMLGHHDVGVTITGDRFIGRVSGADVPYRGRYAHAAGRWIALVVDDRDSDERNHAS